MITVRLSKNRYEIEVLVDGKPLPVASAEIAYEGKLRVLTLKVFDFTLLPDSTCQERNRFEHILAAFGDSAKIAALHPKCSLISINPTACNGCPDRPI